jgi:hypothetical protein
MNETFVATMGSAELPSGEGVFGGGGHVGSEAAAVALMGGLSVGEGASWAGVIMGGCHVKPLFGPAASSGECKKKEEEKVPCE